MNELDPDVARWLVGDAGTSAVAVATAELDAGTDEIAHARRLRRDGLDASRATAVLAAAAARRRARARWPDADRLLFTRHGLEQASDPEVARWRARRSAGAEVFDLCAGIGGDALALAAAGSRVTAVDLDVGRLALLAHNAATLGLTVDTVAADVLSITPSPGVLVHADPGRRRDGRRVRRLAEHRPPVDALVRHLEGVPGLGVALSPALDLDDPALPPAAEIEFVQVGRDLVEAVAWTGTLRRDGACSRATLLPQGVTRWREARAPGLPVGPVGNHLVEVVPAAVRARLHDELGFEVGARRIALRRALLTVDEPPPSSPWYRVRAVAALLPARPAAVRRWLAHAEELPLEIAVHGLDTDLGWWWRALGRPPRGPAGRRLDLVRTDDGAHAILSRDAAGRQE